MQCGDSDFQIYKVPQGDKSKYSDKQAREAEHIADRYRKKGWNEGKAKGVAWATVNKVIAGLLSHQLLLQS